jgi:hypothetical protein
MASELPVASKLANLNTVNSRFFGFEGNGENEQNMCENEKS